MKAICEGRKTRREVVQETLEQYRNVYMRTQQRLPLLHAVSLLDCNLRSIADSFVGYTEVSSSIACHSGDDFAVYLVVASDIKAMCGTIMIDANGLCHVFSSAPINVSSGALVNLPLPQSCVFVGLGLG